jgi:hypothetical protein
MPVPRTLGDETNIGGEKWICVKPCTLVGLTIKNNTPVIMGLDGPEIHDGHFMRARYFKTLPKPGQSYMEIMALRGYSRISPSQLVGKKVRYCHERGDSILVVCTDNSYFKLTAERDRYDDDLLLMSKDLTIQDLRNIGAISDEDYAKYEEERETCRKINQEADKVRRFKLAAAQVGLGTAKVEELLRDV